MSRYEELRARFHKGHITGEQLQRYAQLGVLTEQQAQTILDTIQVEVMPRGVYRRMAQGFAAESTEKGTALSPCAGYCAKEYPAWTAGESYQAGALLQHEGVALQVRQPVTAQEHQPPFSEGMTAIYIPYLVPDEYGIKPFKVGCAVQQGERFYGEDGQIYQYIAVDNPSCIYPPSQELPALWELVEEG